MTLKELREAKTLTQDQVAERSAGAISQASISQLELGRVPDPRVSIVATLAEIYEVDQAHVLEALGESVRAASASAA